MARILVDYAAGVRAKETVLLSGTSVAEPLLKELYARVVAKGAYPLLRMSIPELEHIFYTSASDSQLRHVSPIAYYEARHIDAAIYVQSESNTKYLSAVDPKKIAAARQARRRLNDIVHGRVRWTLTLFPTAAYAQDAGMSCAEFERFVAQAMFADRPDPIREWENLAKRQEALARRLNKVRTVRIVGEDTDLSLSVAGRKFISSDGRHNMPSGEVFTGPVENSAEGRIRFTYPVCFSGKEVTDVALTFRRGVVVEATAAANQDFLRTMIGLDPGAKRLGELGIGTNFGIDRFIKNILFDEKIGGTIHLALGNSYPETGGKNKSALHWDMIKDLRRGGEVWVDGKLFQKNGRFISSR